MEAAPVINFHSEQLKRLPTKTNEPCETKAKVLLNLQRQAKDIIIF